MVLLERVGNKTTFDSPKIKHLASFVKFIHYSHLISKNNTTAINCQNLNEYWWDNVKSIKTFESFGCVRVFNDLNCNGESIRLSEVKKKSNIKYNGSWFTQNSIKSLGICQ